MAWGTSMIPNYLPGNLTAAYIYAAIQAGVFERCFFTEYREE
jgi:hypothetical protein